MSELWIIGRKATMASNGHSYIAEPFIAFTSEAAADAACDMVEKVSGERPMKATASLYKDSRSIKAGVAGGEARAASLTPERRTEIARKAANTRHHGKSA